MDTMVATLVKCLDHKTRSLTNVIPWSSPVPSFGDVSKAKVATLGINPSNREFMDNSGKELEGSERRFHTLRSLGLAHWSEANAQHLKLIIDSCFTYFYVNPYDGWFKKLDRVISGTNASYYHGPDRACHLDLIPYATACKWTTLSRQQRLTLLEAGGNTLSLLLRDSPVRLLVLNGNCVVEQFQAIAGICLKKQQMRDWALPRSSGSSVPGYSFMGSVRNLCGIDLEREILVLGFNHNIQSSFGVTKNVVTAIQKWITKSSIEALDAR